MHKVLSIFMSTFRTFNFALVGVFRSATVGDNFSRWRIHHIWSGSKKFRADTFRQRRNYDLFQDKKAIGTSVLHRFVWRVANYYTQPAQMLYTFFHICLGNGLDYMNVGIKNGGVALTVQLGTGKLDTTIEPEGVRFDDNQWHFVNVTRKSAEVSKQNHMSM